jgi:hypothetical protein
MPGIGISIFLFAVGAILALAVNVDATGVDLDTIGVILMVVGAVGFLASMLFWAPWAPYGRDRTVVRDREVVDRTTHTH